MSTELVIYRTRFQRLLNAITYTLVSVSAIIVVAAFGFSAGFLYYLNQHFDGKGSFVDTVRLTAVSLLLTTEEQQKVDEGQKAIVTLSTCQKDVASLRNSVDILSKEVVLKNSQLKVAELQVEAQKQRISNALVIEGSFKEIYANRMQPRISAVGHAVSEGASSTSAYIKSQYHRLVGE